MKQCVVCKEFREIAEFGKDKYRPDGLCQQCKPCRKAYREKNRERIREWHREYRAEHREELNAKSREKWPEYKERCSETRKAYREKNRDKLRENGQRTYQRNREKVLARCKQHYEENKDYYTYKVALRRARLLERTPDWADLDQIYQFYANCPDGYVVDHIIPIAGKTVSGLHVLENLQYLLHNINNRKSKRVLEELLTPYPSCSLEVYYGQAGITSNDNGPSEKLRGYDSIGVCL